MTPLEKKTTPLSQSKSPFNGRRHSVGDRIGRCGADFANQLRHLQSDPGLRQTENHRKGTERSESFGWTLNPPAGMRKAPFRLFLSQARCESVLFFYSTQTAMMCRAAHRIIVESIPFYH